MNNIEANFGKAHQKTVEILSDYITGGYVQTLARVLVYVGEKQAEEILQKLSEPLQTQLREAYKNLSDKKTTDPDIISTAGPILKNAGFYRQEMSGAVLEGLTMEELSELLARSDEFFEIDPLLAMNIEQDNFTFSDLTELDDRSIQKVLREVDQQELAMALKNSEREVQDKIFRNMSKRAAAMLQEDMEFMGPVRLTDVYDSQKKILDIVKRLKKSGDIVIPNKNLMV